MDNPASPGARKALFLTGEMTLGGGAMFVMNVCEGLRGIGGEWQGVAGVFSNLGEVGQQMLDRSLPVIGPFEDAVLHEDYMEAMHAECARLKPDAVVANLGGDAFDFMRLVPAEVLRVGVIHSDRENVYRIVNAYSEWLDVVVAVSTHAAEVFRKSKKDGELKVTSLSCGIPISSETRVRSSGAPLRVLYLGRLVDEQKRATMMGRIIRESLRRQPSMEWTLIGDGPQLESMRESFADVEDKVRFTGPLGYAAVQESLPKHDVFFLCSDYEGLPLSMLEGMSAGLVPVVSDLPSGISEVVHDGNGIRIPMNEESAYVDALLMLSENPETLESMSQQARKDVIEEYSVQAMARRWSGLFSEHGPADGAIWELREPVGVPPISKSSWIHHPRLRPLRRIMRKLCKRKKKVHS